jgi:hypothetical protein
MKIPNQKHLSDLTDLTDGDLIGVYRLEAVKTFERKDRLK